jgi:anti-anti-sigma factor
MTPLTSRLPLRSRAARYEISRSPARTVVTLCGEYDSASSNGLSALLTATVGDSQGDVEIDLSQVRFFDASTIGRFVACRDLLAREKRSLTLRGPTPLGAQILSICGLGDLIVSPRTATDRTALNP